MIRYETGKGVMIEGTLSDILTETCIMVNDIYRGLSTQDENAGKIYRAFITEGLGKIVFDPNDNANIRVIAMDMLKATKGEDCE